MLNSLDFQELSHFLVRTYEGATLYNDILRIARNLLETRENIKIESILPHHLAILKNGHFEKSAILDFFA